MSVKEEEKEGCCTHLTLSTKQEEVIRQEVGELFKDVPSNWVSPTRHKFLFVSILILASDCPRARLGGRGVYAGGVLTPVQRKAGGET